MVTYSRVDYIFYPIFTRNISQLDFKILFVSAIFTRNVHRVGKHDLLNLLFKKLFSGNKIRGN